jgi:hypothetical protein
MSWWHGADLSDNRERKKAKHINQGVRLKKIVIALSAWIAVITGAHLATNVDWKVVLNERLPESERKLNVAYIPVT